MCSTLCPSINYFSCSKKHVFGKFRIKLILQRNESDPENMGQRRGDKHKTAAAQLQRK